MPELLARLRVALRHRQLVASVADPTVLRIGDLSVDTGAYAAFVAGEPLDLTRKEFGLLALLARNLGKVLVHRSILDSVWGPGNKGTTESLRVHITNLRRKLGTGSTRPQVLTEPGVGYRLVLPE
jgi:two-component system KDP operon response regulator KdpE